MDKRKVANTNLRVVWSADAPATKSGSVERPDRASEPDEALSLTLRSLDDVPAASDPAEIDPADGAAPDLAASLPEIVRSDPEFVCPSALDPGVDAEPPTRSALKAAHRAVVRRARQSTALPDPGASLASPDVMLLEQNETDRVQLRSLLEDFGFCVHPARDIRQANAMLSARAFAAAFLDIVLDGAPCGPEAALCQRVKDQRQPSGQATALIITSEGGRSVDRVRASLAGCDAFLRKPLGRGDVVRALQDGGVVLPLDARSRY